MRRRSKTGGSYQRVQGSARSRRLPRPAQAPYRRLDTRPDWPAGFPDASGRYRSFRAARLFACDRLALDTFPGQTRICFGSSPSRNDGNGRHSRCDAAISPDRPSFRRPDRSRSNLLPAASQRLEPHTPQGYIRCMRTNAKAAVLKRLRRIEGQVRGLARMVEDDRYCIDVVTQLSAVRAALRRAEEEILADHAAHCVENAIASGNKTDQRRKVAELIDVLSRSDR